jgi:endonuclease/exonuclease/phosphatase family metal-dependent hydrolase
MLLQEVDTDATRSYGVDQRAYLGAAFPTYNKTFAQNYDSPYLFYPIFSPHGASKSGLFTLATSGISSANRVELPVEKGLMKFLDLDRCYHKITLPTDNGKTLCLYNLHLSAYTSDGTIATEQIRLLVADMQAEYDRGNYVIAGGDFNKDLRGDDTAICGNENNWAQPFPTALLGADFSLIADHEGAHSCRNCDIGYMPGVTFEVTVDGFIVSKNVTVNSVQNINEGFNHSDHNPVKMSFTLQ